MTSCLHQLLNILTFQNCGTLHKLELKAAIIGDRVSRTDDVKLYLRYKVTQRPRRNVFHVLATRKPGQH
jgi:hypothetical protein